MLGYDTFVNTTTGYYVGSTSVADSYKPSDYGITGARWCKIDVLTDNADVVVTTGISGTISDPNNGSYRVGRNYGMSFIQLPVSETTEVRVKADPVAGITCLYTVAFID